MRALGLIVLGSVLGAVGLALWVAYESDLPALSIFGVVLALAGGAVAIVGLVQNHRDHTTARR